MAKGVPVLVRLQQMIQTRSKMKYLLGLGGALLAVVIFGWYCSENFSGRINRNAEMIGYALVRPGHVVDSILSGNFHGGFGDWRDPIVKIGVSYFVWLLPCLIIAWLFQRNSGQGRN